MIIIDHLNLKSLRGILVIQPVVEIISRVLDLSAEIKSGVTVYSWKLHVVHWEFFLNPGRWNVDPTAALELNVINGGSGAEC